MATIWQGLNRFTLVSLATRRAVVSPGPMKTPWPTHGIPRRSLLAGSVAGPLSGALSSLIGGSPAARQPLAPQRDGKPSAGGEHRERSTLRVLIPEGSEANLEPVAKAFREARAVDVLLETCGVDDVATEMTLRTIAGAANFDLALPPTFSIPDLVEAGIIQPLDLSGAKPGPQGQALEVPPPPSLFPLGDSYKGTKYGYQTDGDVYLMFFNKRLLEDAPSAKRFADRYGRDLEIPQTWQELDEAMEFFHQPEEEQFGGTLFRSTDYIAWEFWIRLHAKGIFPVDDEMKPLLASPEGIAAARELIAASQWLSPDSATAGLFDNWKTFGEGRTFCNLGWGGSQKYFRRPGSKIRDSVIAAPTPGGRIDGSLARISYFNWGWNFTVSSRTSQRQLSTEFARFATSGDAAVQAVRAADGFFDPYLDAHYEDEAIEKIYTRPFLHEHRKSMAQAIPDFYLAGRGEYFDLLGRFLAAANMGKIDVEDALKVVTSGWNLITDRLGRKSQQAQWQFIKGRYPSDLKQVLRSTV